MALILFHCRGPRFRSERLQRQATSENLKAIDAATEVYIIYRLYAGSQVQAPSPSPKDKVCYLVTSTHRPKDKLTGAATLSYHLWPASAWFPLVAAGGPPARRGGVGQNVTSQFKTLLYPCDFLYKTEQLKSTRASGQPSLKLSHRAQSAQGGAQPW